MNGGVNEEMMTRNAFHAEQLKSVLRCQSLPQRYNENTSGLPAVVKRLYSFRRPGLEKFGFCASKTVLKSMETAKIWM